MGSDCKNEAENCLDLNTSTSPETNIVPEPRKDSLPGKDSLGPITPDSDRENGDFTAQFHSSPTPGNTVETSALNNSETENGKGENGSPHTPKEGVFDPFAPGPDHMAMAPQCRKQAMKSRAIVARRLSFDDSMEESIGFKECGCGGISISDEEIVEAVYESLLETIVSRQKEAVLVEVSDRDWDSSDCVTPPSATRLNGIAETCPGAPRRPVASSRRVDPVLCRRLQFSP